MLDSTFVLFLSDCQLLTDWVLKLGPKEARGPNAVPQYQYSIVSGPFRTTLFVLARDPDDFRARFEADILQWLKTNHFDRFYNKPIQTVQMSDCDYPPPGGKLQKKN